MSLRSVPDVGAERASRRVREGLEQVAFWGSIALPAAYLPLLIDGLPEGELGAFLALVAVNVACLVAGHRVAR